MGLSDDDRAELTASLAGAIRCRCRWSSGGPPQATDDRDCQCAFCVLSPALERFARRRLNWPGAPSAKDFSQNLCCEILQKLGDFAPDLSTQAFVRWLARRARSRVIDPLRRFDLDCSRQLDADDELIADPAAPDPQALVAGGDLAAWLKDRLRPCCTAVNLDLFWRVTMDGEPSGDVGNALGLDPRQVAKRLYLTTQRARRLVATQDLPPDGRKQLSNFFCRNSKHRKG